MANTLGWDYEMRFTQHFVEGLINGPKTTRQIIWETPMTIEELKAELERFNSSNENWAASRVIENLKVRKLLAVAEAAILEREKQNAVGDTVCVELHDAIDDLLEAKPK